MQWERPDLQFVGLDEAVVIDVETTGLDPEVDRDFNVSN